MCDFEGMTRRILTIPPDFVPYMEKHRLYEFFYELITQVLIQQPEDPIVFMKQCIQHAIRKRDIPRIILIASPNFDKITLAKILQKEIGTRPVTLEDLYASSLTTGARCQCYDAEDIAMRMKNMLMSGILHESGWTLIDIPRTKKEARALQRVGIIPSHVIRIIPPNVADESQVPDYAKQMTTFDTILPHKLRSFSKKAEQYKHMRIVRDLCEVYANLLIEIQAGTRSILELGKDCAALTKIRKHYGAPSFFRIVLLGPRGSGRHSLAKHMSERFNLVHVDFDCILEQVCLQETALDEILRLCEHRCERKLRSEIKIQIVKKFVLESECLQKGWILTNFPVTVEEFKLLDMIPTPPNKIIVLEADAQTCRERLLNRRYNIITRSAHNLISSSSKMNRYCKLPVYLSGRKKDHENVIERDLQEYEKNKGSIMRYVGDTAFVIDATREQKFVKEKSETYLMQSLVAKPRIPQPSPTIDPIDIEFDPDDEPDPSIFNNIRASEPKYFFI